MFFFVGQGLFYWCLVTSTIASDKVEAVLVYTGEPERVGVGFRHATMDEATLLVTSGWDLDEARLRKTVPKRAGFRILTETKARTTDQNARYLKPMLKEAGVKTAELVLPWYHLPRAYFLTRLYFLGTGIQVIPVADPPAPPGWWRHSVIWVEYVKLWGSLARVGLACLGIENWPAPQIVPTRPS
ncbi:MAG TPA: YdcF family protein [bacterium]|nr:YdcF family protein [bacterium]